MPACSERSKVLSNLHSAGVFIPMKHPLGKLSLEEHFWKRVKVWQLHECWIWQPYFYKAFKDKNAYGHFQHGSRKEPAHRMAWILTNGEIPEGLEVCHKCDNPPCCNPTHLFLGTHKDNMGDCAAKGRNHVPPQQGELHSQAKLKDSDVLKIRELWNTGQFTLLQLANQFGVGFVQIHRIVYRKNWNHI